MTLMTLTMIRGTIVDEDENELEATLPVTVNTEHLRSFNPRKDNRIGTRLTFAHGGGFAVTETYDEVSARLNGSQRLLAAN